MMLRAFAGRMHEQQWKRHRSKEAQTPGRGYNECQTRESTLNRLPRLSRPLSSSTGNGKLLGTEAKAIPGLAQSVALRCATLPVTLLATLRS